MRQHYRAPHYSRQAVPGRRSIVAIRYVAFALLSTAVNLVTQAIVFRWEPLYPLAASIGCGTAAGFAVKYVLDKRWIFYDPYDSAERELAKVVLYGLFSVATTLLFWASEVLFWIVWHTAAAKYTGAVLGLSIGYAVKYGLDRTYVFRRGPA